MDNFTSPGGPSQATKKTAGQISFSNYFIVAPPMVLGKQHEAKMAGLPLVALGTFAAQSSIGQYKHEARASEIYYDRIHSLALRACISMIFKTPKVFAAH